MANRSFYSQRIRTFRIVSGILIVVSLVAIIWGVRALIAHGGLQGASLAALYAVAFGLCALIIGVIILAVFWSRDVAYRRMTQSDHPAWIRWQCSAEEARRFVAAEASKRQLSMPSHRSMIITAICIAAALALIQRTNFTWGGFLIANAIVNGCVIGFLFYLRAVSAAKLKDTIVRASTEVIMDDEGVLAGETVFKWRGVNMGLQQATYEAGQPDVLNLVFLAGTLPGSGVVRNTQSTLTVRIPVTASKADEVRQILATRISQHVIGPGGGAAA